MEVRNIDGTKITANKNYLGQNEKDKPIAKKYRKKELIRQAIYPMSNHIFLSQNGLILIYDRQHLSEKRSCICTHGKSIFYSDHLDAWVKNTLARIKFKRFESI